MAGDGFPKKDPDSRGPIFDNYYLVFVDFLNILTMKSY